MPEADSKLILLFLSSSLIFLLLVVLIIVFAVVYQRKVFRQREKLQQLESERQLAMLRASIEGREETQAQIAKDLHDELGALMSTIKLHVAQFGSKFAEHQEVLKHTETITHLLSDGIGSVRRITNDLLPPTLRDFGIKAAIAEIVDRVNEAKKLKLAYHYTLQEERLDAEIELPLYRIVQELINNTLKHGQADEASLSIHSIENQIELNYRDDGKGFDPSITQKNLGLKNLENRAALLHGTFTLQAKPGEGIQANISFPYLKPSKA